jgi:hypothetical protein
LILYARRQADAFTGVGDDRFVGALSADGSAQPASDKIKIIARSMIGFPFNRTTIAEAGKRLQSNGQTA